MESTIQSTWRLFGRRMWRAAKLDVSLYEEVEADKSALPQAVGAVVLSSLAAGIGTIGEFGEYGYIAGGVFWALVTWIVWAALTYWIGAHLLPEPQTKADLGEMLRTTGFSSVPGVIRVAGILPGLTEIVFLTAALWMLVAMVIAIRQALDYRSTWRAIGVCLIGWLIQAMVLIVTLRAAANPYLNG